MNSYQLSSIYSQDLETKKTWYSPAAIAYNQTRPGYSQEIISRLVKLAEIPNNGRILEIGCGPGNATVAFAEQGFSILSIEPNSDFCVLAKENCQSYPKVEILNTSFEEWQLEAEQFDIVLAATSIHWISPEIVYPKAADVLKETGSLILLWNVIPEPNPVRYKAAKDLYKTYAPSLAPYENKEAQKAKLKGFEEMILSSGKFTDIVSDAIECEKTYSIEDYLKLLSTLSPYLKIEEQNRNTLFEKLSQQMHKDSEDRILMSYLCAFQVARKN
ncbi:MAG: class I SAM-dependent methyltransferase [Cyanobacteriota bacterium]|nr:class I SAM-dependent methyltransferase [Cyanobacteriota bacterium]